MTELDTPSSTPARSRVRVSAAIALIAVCVVAAWLVALRMQAADATDTPVASTPATGITASGPAAVDAAAVIEAAATVGHAVYWAGERGDEALELTLDASGSVFVRYLPAGVEVGAEAPYLTVATYPDANAYANLAEAAKQPGAVSVKYAGGALAVAASKTATNVNFGFEGANIQIEVFSPVPGEAWDLIESGAIVQAL